MPTYELALVLRQMTRPELISTLKRTAGSILDKGCIIRKLNNLGTRELPYKISEHGQVHRTGSYFAIEFDSPPTKLDDLNEEFGRDIDIIRRNFYKVDEKPKEYKCTLHEELLPPAYRKEVQEMIKIGQKKQKKKYDLNCGYNYYPF